MLSPLHLVLTDYTVSWRDVAGKTPPAQDVDCDEPELDLGAYSEIVHTILLVLAVVPDHHVPPLTLLHLDLDEIMFDGQHLSDDWR